MKYIKFTVRLKGSDILKQHIIVVPNDICHDNAALHYTAACRIEWPGCEIKVISAGEVSLFVESTHGKSTTLGLESDPGDATVLNNMDYGGYLDEPLAPKKIKKPASDVDKPGAKRDDTPRRLRVAKAASRRYT